MLSAISITIWRFRKYLVLSLVISMIAIPFANFLVIERDRNRNEMYGEAFWRFGFNVYSMTDDEVAEALGYDPENYTLPEYLGNVTYEYPVFGLIFFAIAAWLFPGQGGVQPLWLNFILALVFNLNLVLVAILLGERIFKKNWARLLFGGYYVYGLIMSAGGGKLEPIVDCLLLMALVLSQEEQHGKAMFTLGLSVQTKVYSVVALPLLLILSPLSIIWFFASTLLTVIPFFFLGADFSTLVSHFLNTTDYSSYIVNPMYPGLFLGTPEVNSNPVTFYMWPPALIPLVIYVAFILFTFRMYLPGKAEFMKATLREKFILLFPLYIYLLPAILFVFRWVMPWYLFWLGPMIFMFKEDRHAVGYLKQLTVVGLVYSFGVFCNWPYFISGPLPDFMIHFPLGWYTLLGLVSLLGSAAVAYGIWKWTFERRERKAQLIREARVRGELII